MIEIFLFCVCFLASIIGAICGIGGGIIIKPVLDAVGVMDVTTISFLSGCTVLSMSTYSVVKSKLSDESRIDKKVGLPLAIGATIGGMNGKLIFQHIVSLSSNQNETGAIQAGCLFIVTIGTLIYIICKDRINTHKISNKIGCIIIGLILGLISSFLGIGGGPINLVVLVFFFSMDTKTAAENSLYIIFFSQAASLMQAIVIRSIPEFSIGALGLMVSGGIMGGSCGRFFNKKMDKKRVDGLLVCAMLVIIMINLYNLYKFR